jgi:hypothetical protein
MPKESPKAGEGQKDIYCKHYMGCLTYAARENIRAFNCESCDCFKTDQKEKPGEAQMENKKICNKCNDRPTISKFSKYCPACLNSFKKDKEKGPEAPKKKKAASGKAGPEKAPKTPDTAVKIEFGKYVSVFKEVEKLANREMRPLDMQIVYMLNNQLKIEQ